MSKRFKTVLVAGAFLVLASLACSEDPDPPRLCNIIVSDKQRYNCVSYEYLDDGDLQLTDCVTVAWNVKVENLLIINPTDVTISCN